MTTTSQLDQYLLDQVVRFSQPLQAANSPDKVVRLVSAIGWDFSAVTGVPMDQLAAAVSTAATAFMDFAAVIETGPLSLGILAKTLTDAGQAFLKIRSVIESWTPTGPGLPSDAIATFAEDLLGFLLDVYLIGQRPRLRSLLMVAGVYEVALAPEIKLTNSAVVRRAQQRPQWDLQLLMKALTDPAGFARQRFGTLAGVEAIADLAGPLLADLLREVGVAAHYGTPGAATDALLSSPEVAAAQHLLHVRLALATDGVDAAAAILEVTFGLAPTTGGQLSLAMVPRGTLAASKSVGSWTLGASLTGTIAPMLINSSGVTFTSGHLNPSLQMATSAVRNPTKDPMLRLGGSTGTRLELGGVSFTQKFGATAAGSGPAPGVTISAGIELVKAQLIVAGGDGDGFLSAVLPAQPVVLDIPLALDWSLKKGFVVRGAQSLSIDLAPHKPWGPVNLSSLRFEFRGDPAGPVLEISVSGSLTIGPVVAVLERTGVDFKLATAQGAGAFGPLDLKVRFKPPNGIGLSVDATAITGGGYLFFDDAKQEYAGILDLEFADRFSLTVIAVLDTKNGFSLMGLVFVADFTPIPLGLGFFLEGVGGMLAINRTAAVDKLRSGLKTGSMKSLLFPEEPVKHAHQIIADLDADFPRADSRYLFGPMAEITWGDPTLVTIKIALLIELPEPVRLIIVAQLEALLPDPDKAVIKLHMDALGVVNFGTDDLSLDAVLYDSKWGAFTVTGAMALRMNWGSQPNFALAVGGFSPSYTPPANFPKVERIVIALAAGDNPRIRLDAYLAITSNTFQVGAHLDLHAAAGGFALDGHLGFDVLIHFDPFAFIADMHASLSLTYNGSVLMGVDLHLTLSGPSPLEATGTATFQVFIFSASVSFDVTIGTALPAGPGPAVPDLETMLRTALEDLRNWSATMPADSKTAFAVRPRSSLGKVFVHPLGDLSAHQRVVPIGLSINNYGTIPLAMPVKFTLSVTIENAPDSGEQPINDFFAPAQFQQLTDSQKLARPSFEQYQSGVRFGSSKAMAGSTRQSTIDYKSQVVDTIPAPKATAMAQAATLVAGPDYPLSGASLESQIPTGAAARAKGNTTGSAKYAGVASPVAAAQPTYVIAGASDLLQPSGTDQGTYSQAVDLLRAQRAANPNLDLQIVVSHERRQITSTVLTALTFGTPAYPAMSPQWVNSKTQLTIAPGNNVLKALYYRVHAVTADARAYTAVSVRGVTFSISGSDGPYDVEWFGVDLHGAEENPQKQVVYLDNIPAQTTLLSTPQPLPGGPQLTLTATDAGSGVATVSYRAFQQGQTANFKIVTGDTVDITINGEGSWEVDVQATDNVGNVSPLQTTAIQTDTTPPTSTLTVGAPGYPDDPQFVTASTTLVVSAIDSGSGVQSISYRVYAQGAGGTVVPTTTTHSSVHLSLSGKDGPYQVEYQATDNAGNVETLHVKIITLDTTPPQSQLVIGDPKAGGPSTFVTSGTPLTLNAVDAGSGVAKTSYTLSPNGGAVPVSIPPAAAIFKVTGPDAAYQVDYQSVDNLGNTEQLQSQTVNLDNTAPLITVTAPMPTTHDANIVLAYTADDGTGSGVASLTSTLDGAATVNKQLITNLLKGPHVFVVTAVDNLGNQSTASVPFTVT